MSGNKVAAAVTALSLSFCAAGAVNLVENGGFETVNPVVKSQHLMKSIRNGWKYDRGPVAFFPKGWWINSRRGVFKAVDASEDDSLLPHVRTGKGSMYVAGIDGGTSSVYDNVTKLPRGRHRIRYWTKGTAKVRLLVGSYTRERCVGNDDGKLEAQPSRDWVLNETSIDVGAGHPEAVRFTLAFQVSGGEAWIDDLEIVKEAE